jgi:hypothetical protein
MTNKRNEEAIIFFWKIYRHLIDRYEFLIITTGRGRDWISNLARKEDILKKIRYVPIESLEKCFILGEMLEPNAPALGIKYALIKTIIGS